VRTRAVLRPQAASRAAHPNTSSPCATCARPTATRSSSTTSPVVPPGAKIGVVGPNGAGKSTLLKIMAGLDHANNGDAILDPGYTVGMLQQEPPLNEGKTVLENVEEAVGEIKGKLDRFNEISPRWATPTPTSTRCWPRWASCRPTSTRQRVGPRLPARAGDGRAALPAADADVDNLSGGERRRVALCKLLLQQPDLLLLDEPTNHLDAESVQWLEQHLQELPGAVLAVTHDRYFLDNVAEWILELDRGRATPTRATTRRTSRPSRTASRSRARRTPSAPRCSRRARVGALQRQGPPDQEQGASGPLRGDGGRGRQGPQDRPPRSTSRRARASVTSCSRPRT
jgi:ATPase subunit of ABC transporter with duplicated ATPase domains